MTVVLNAKTAKIAKTSWKGVIPSTVRLNYVSRQCLTTMHACSPSQEPLYRVADAAYPTPNRICKAS